MQWRVDCQPWPVLIRQNVWIMRNQVAQTHVSDGSRLTLMLHNQAPTPNDRFNNLVLLYPGLNRQFISTTIELS